LRVRAGMDDMNGLAQPYFDYHIAVQGEPETYTVEETPRLPQVDGGEPIDTAMLAKIDAHMHLQPPTQR
jgi:hypothetical protein